MGRPCILVIDDHALFRSGISTMLMNALGRVLTLETDTVEDALALADVDPALVLLDIQLQGVSGLEGIASLRRHWPISPIIVVSGLDTPSIVADALKRGAAAFLSKSERPEHMVSLVRNLLGSTVSGRDRPPDEHATLDARSTALLNLHAQGLSNKVIGRRLGLPEYIVRGHVQALQTRFGTFRSEASGSRQKAPDRIGHDAAHHPGMTIRDLSPRELEVLRLIGEGYSLSEIAADLNLSVKTIGTYRDRLKVKLGVERVSDLIIVARDHLRW